MSTNDPIARFTAWLEEAGKHPAIHEPTAMCLATSTPDGKPSARIVLLKECDARGFVFYSNRESRKGRELAANSHAALCFYWEELGRQVRVEGHVEPVTDAEADEYFQSRARESRIGAWASRQSWPLASRDELMQRVAEEEARFAQGDVPRPAHWSGWRLVPERMEFWQEGKFRLHDRDVYARDGSGWNVQKLFP